mmetsp:Transcript_24331/g.67352  ORF Transcript_24331/g.67352 Transcript_24331/m.67352 type:complete len:92 (-) Transcript_24331:141-416(-)
MHIQSALQPGQTSRTQRKKDPMVQSLPPAQSNPPGFDACSNTQSPFVFHPSKRRSNEIVITSTQFRNNEFTRCKPNEMLGNKLEIVLSFRG